MALLSISIPSLSDSTAAPSLFHTFSSLKWRPSPSNSIHFLNPSSPTLRPCLCRAANSQPGPLPKQSSSAAPKKRKKKGKGDTKVFNPSDLEAVEDFSVDEAGPSSSSSDSSYLSYHPTTLPKPPAGFVLDDHGKVLMASTKRIATMVSDDEVEAILPAAAYALAKIHMHLVHSGFCYTARGGFCYSEDDIFDFRTDDGQDVDGLPNEGVEITCFHMDGAHYMIYTPSDPLLFVATKDKLGQLTIADDELLEDPAIISAIDKETEFNALVEEEAALLESVLGKE
ncbi:uncharacterized protein LOC111024390 isoform X3 [Momordica charantia]|uniref:Uncharacterized protein LOC111024390 isoform X3 n=1 Tax=Momordica charantia TaxID=3673 RepID=A0A6J1DZ59_MOMCH|nr:uncharacterized protein LOC111024390 isoform X3 [Momordica charantia]